MAFFKKRATVQEVGNSLFEMARNEITEQMDKEALEALEAEPGEESERILFELFILRLFAVDFAVYSYVRESGPARAMLDAHYDHLREVAATVGDPEEFFAELKPRLLAYGRAVSTDHVQGPAWQAGKTFSERAGYSQDIACSMVGVGMFSATLAGVRDLLGRVRIAGT